MKISIFALVILASSSAATKDASFDGEVYKELDKELDELQTLMKEYENSSEESNLSEDDCPVFTQNPVNNEELTELMLAATKPCGHYKNIGCDYEVIPANIVHPGFHLGNGPDELHFRPYIVQFDIGINQNIKDKVLSSYESWGEGTRGCIGCDQTGEQCLELIVEGGSDATGTGCAGRCGSGCLGAGYAKDCMKHDVCATYKALIQRNSFDVMDGDGMCYDPDCGDEAAQTVHNCFIDNWGLDTPITCERENFDNRNARGRWSTPTYHYSSKFDSCGNYQNWNNGQGFPDKEKITNPYD